MSSSDVLEKNATMTSEEVVRLPSTFNSVSTNLFNVVPKTHVVWFLPTKFIGIRNFAHRYLHTVKDIYH